MGFIEKVMRRPGVAHIMAANDRYNKRLGPQFSAAVTYFSVLSLAPILMFAFSMLGMTLTVLRPDWLERVNDAIANQLGDSDSVSSIKEFIKNALENWRGVAIFAVLTAAYSGANWIGNLKRAFRVMWRKRFSDALSKSNIVVQTLENLVIFLGTLLCFGIALAVTVMGGNYSQAVIDWMGLTEVPGIDWILRLVTIALTFLACWLLFAFLFIVFPGERTNARTFLIATVFGALAVTALQQLAGLLIGAFSKNAAASLFGSVIVIMLLFNLLATIILMTAAWAGTADTWQQDQLRKDVDKAAGLEEKTQVDIDDHDAGAEVPPAKPISRVDQLRTERFAARRPAAELRADNFDPDQPTLPAAVPVSPEVAQRSVKIASGVGYGLGAATGLGVGALLTSALRRLRRRP